MDGIKNNFTVGSLNRVNESKVNKTKAEKKEVLAQNSETKLNGLDAIGAYNVPVVRKKEFKLSPTDLNKLASFAAELDLDKEQIASVKKYLTETMQKNNLHDFSEFGEWLDNLYDEDMNEYVAVMQDIENACGVDDDMDVHVDNIFDKYITYATDDEPVNDYYGY